MINLFLNFYIDQRPDRQQELEFCLRDNIKNNLIDKVYLLADPSIVYEWIKIESKVVIIPFTERPTYSQFFQVINKVTDITDINIISNSDIFFDESLLLLGNITQSECYALSRWNMEANGSINLFARRDSQDVWVFRGVIDDSLYLSSQFCLGKPGCDNRIAYEIEQVGYRIYNPCLSIRTIHFHNTEVRNFSWDDMVDRIHPPYLLLDPEYL